MQVEIEAATAAVRPMREADQLAKPYTRKGIPEQQQRQDKLDLC